MGIDTSYGVAFGCVIEVNEDLMREKDSYYPVPDTGLGVMYCGENTWSSNDDGRFILCVKESRISTDDENLPQLIPLAAEVDPNEVLTAVKHLREVGILTDNERGFLHFLNTMQWYFYTDIM